MRKLNFKFILFIIILSLTLKTYYEYKTKKVELNNQIIEMLEIRK